MSFGAKQNVEHLFYNSARRTVFLWVEGGSDEKFWYPRIDRSGCQIRIAGGRERALEEIRNARQTNDSLAIAILDADFDRFEGTLQNIEGIFWTDQPDLEGMLIASPALEKVLAAFCSRDKRMPTDQLRRDLWKQASQIGRLRYVSRREKLGLTFRKPKKNEEFHYINYSDFCSKESWEVDVQAMIKHVLDFSQKHRLNAGDLERQCKDLGLEAHTEPEHLCNGHDLVGILLIGFKKKLGSQQHLNQERLEEVLWAAFELSYLQQTVLGQSLYAWELAHPGFRVLRAA